MNALLGVIFHSIGGLTYGLGVRYLGMSLGNSVVLGFCAAFGAIVPSIYYSIIPTSGKVSFTHMMTTTGGRLVLLGVLVCLIGIAISGKAGMMKEKELSEEEQIKSKLFTYEILFLVSDFTAGSVKQLPDQACNSCRTKTCCFCRSH